MAKQHTRPDLHAAIELRFPDNTNEEITPERLRDGLHELVDAAFLPASDTQLTAHLLGIDAATGEFLVLLSPSAPAAKASYVLADLAGSLTALPASASIASRLLRLPASVSGQTLCLLDANKLPVPLQHLERLPDTIWYYVGDPALASISIGELDLTSNVFDPNGLNEGNVFFAAQFVSDNTIGPDFSGNLVYGELRKCTIGGNCSFNTFRGSVTDCQLGDNVVNCYFDMNTHHVEVGSNCQRVQLYNCAGTPQQPFKVPPGTTDATYLDNQLVNKADEDGRFDLLTPTDRAVPESELAGLVNWRYEVAPPTGTWELKPGKSVMFTVGSALTFPANVQEGDVFGIYINPPSATTRISLATTGGIDELPTKRYTKGIAFVLRYAFVPQYTNANSQVIADHYGLQTLQLTTPTAVNNRGDFAPGTYYLPGDLVTYNKVLYLRQVEGSDTGAFDPAKWAGGGSGNGNGGGAPAAAGTLPLTTTRTAAYTLALADAGCLVPVSSANATAVTLPANADVALPVGSTGFIRRLGTGAVTLAPGTNVQFLPPGVGTALDDYGEVAWHKTDQDTYWLKGDLL